MTTKIQKTLFNPATRRLIQNTSANRKRVNVFIIKYKKKDFFKDINDTFKKKAIIRNTRLRRDRVKTEKKQTEVIAIKEKLREMRITNKSLNKSLKKLGFMKQMSLRKKYINRSRIKMKAYKAYAPKGAERQKRGGDSISIDGVVYTLRAEGIKMIISQPSYKLSKYLNKTLDLETMNIVLKKKIETEDLKFTSGGWLFQIIHVEDISKKKIVGLKSRKLKDNTKKVLCCRYMKIVKNPKCTDIENLVVDISTVKGGCWIDLLLNVYTKSFNKRCKRFKISVDTLIDFLGRKPDNDYSYSIEEVLPFFVKFKLTLKVHDVKGRELFSYMPEKYNDNHPKSMIIVSNNHVYRMNYLIASIEHRVNNRKSDLKAPSIILTL